MRLYSRSARRTLTALLDDIPGWTSLVRDVTGDVALQASDGLLGTDTRWGVTDRLGSTIGQAQGSKVGQLAHYSDWGVPTFDTLGWDSETGYTGELGDATAGVWSFYARSNDPMATTWLRADPYRGDLGNPQTLGRYGYVGNNPVPLTDYLGYAINRLVDGEWGHRNAYRALYKQQQEAKPNPPVPSTSSPFKPLPETPSDASDTSQRHHEQTFPSDQDIWNGLSLGFGITAVVFNGLGALAGFACLAGPQTCAVGLAASRLAGMISLPFSLASSLTDCIGNGWDGKCWAGWLYTGLATVSTVMAPPVVSNGVAGGLQVVWLFTTRWERSTLPHAQLPRY